MAKEFFKNLPNTTTPLTAPRLNALLDGEEAMGNIVVNSIGTSNLFTNRNHKNGYILNDSGTEVADASGGYTTYYIPVTPNTTYTLSNKNNSQFGSTWRIYFFNSSKTFLSRTVGYVDQTTITFTTPSNCYYIEIQYNTNYTLGFEWQIEEGDTKTTYYEGKEYGYISGSNDNGNYIKYDDGTLICSVSKSVYIAMSSQWGSIYESSAVSLGSFPESFISPPIVSATVTYGAAFIELLANTSTTSWGNITLCRPVSTPSAYTYYIDLIAIGRWK